MNTVTIGDCVEWSMVVFMRGGKEQDVVMRGEVVEVQADKHLAHVCLTDMQQARLYGSRHWVTWDALQACAA